MNLFFFTLPDDCFPQMPKHVALKVDKHVTVFFFFIAKNTVSFGGIKL